MTDTTPLTREELEIISHYFSTPGSVPDWPLIQTSKGKVKGPIIGRLIADLERCQELVRRLVRQGNAAITVPFVEHKLGWAINQAELYLKEAGEITE